MSKLVKYFFIILFLNSCGQDNIWMGYLYPDATDLKNRQYIGSFKLLPLCREQSTIEVRAYVARSGSSAIYECGLNCTEENGVRICEKIRQ